MQIELKIYQVVVIVAYAPYDDANVVKEDLVYLELTKVKNIADRKELFILRNLNAQTGSRINNPIVGQHGESDDNGGILIELYPQALKIINGWV